MKLTKAQRAALEYFAWRSGKTGARGACPDPLYKANARTTNGLLARGLLTQRHPNGYGHVITEAGRAALANNP